MEPQNPAQNRQHQGPEQGAEYNALVDMTEDLCKLLPIKDLFPSMISLRVIDIDELCHNRTERKIVERFIQSYLYPDLILGEISRFLKFITAMKRSDKCDVLVGRLEDRIRYHQNNVNFPGKYISVTRYLVQVHKWSGRTNYVEHKWSPRTIYV